AIPRASFVWAITVSKAVEELPGLECRCFSRRAGSGGGSGRGGRSRRSPADVAAEPSRSAAELRSLDPQTIGEKYGQAGHPHPATTTSAWRAGGSANFRRQPAAAIEQAGFRELLNFHNRRVGHLVARKSQTQICNCLGISGSCTKRFCIRGLTRSSGHIERKPARPVPALRLRPAAADLSGQRTDITDIIEEAGRSALAPSRGGRRRRQLRLLNFDLGTGRSHRVKKRPAGLLGRARRTSASRAGRTDSTECPGAHLQQQSGLERAGLLRPPVLRLEPPLGLVQQPSMLYNPIRVHCERCVKVKEMHRCRRHPGCCVATTPKASCFSNLAAQRQHAKPTSVNCKSVKAGRRLGGLACFELARRQGSVTHGELS
uniref:Protein Wnt n=1 Tax=Macrostomum lignano TaxID=282301 RepID=A0A1I8FPE1_9PLAT